jgi:subtilase family serine protease
MKRIVLIGLCLALGVLLLLPGTAGAMGRSHHAVIWASPASVAVGSAPQMLAAPADEIQLFHYYAPFDIRAAYGLDAVGDPTTGAGLLGAGQTIVLIDCYGSPTAAADLQRFHETFYPDLPDPDFEVLYPLGKPNYHNIAKGNGNAGPAAAFAWSGEATLDIDWAYAIAPLAHIVLAAMPPLEVGTFMTTVNGLVASEPAGTVFSMSFAVTEPTVARKGAALAARFDQVFQAGLKKGDTFFAATGDWGTTGYLRAHKDIGPTTPWAYWPASSPYVTAVGGTQVQIGWTWDPRSDVPFTADGDFTPDYFNNVLDPGGPTEVVWNESWGPWATGGGISSIYPRPAWQDGVASIVGGHRGYPDLSWNAAVNGGVLVYISAFPNWQTPDWYVLGGTSASSPQVAAVVALANEKQAQAGHDPIGALNPLLYQIGGSAQGATAFRDILPVTQGTAISGMLDNNGMFVFNADGSVSPGPVAGYPVLTGFDLTTGWGSPMVPAFIDDLTAARNAE